MRHIQKAGIGMAALFALTALAGCGEVIGSSSSTPASSNTDSGSSESSSTSSADPYVVPADYTNFVGDPKTLTATVEFWETFGSSGTTATTMNSYKTEFQKLYPNITVNLTSKGGYPDIKSAISNAIPAGSTPTMATCYPDHVAEYLTAGAVENMSGYVADPLIGLGAKDSTAALGKSDFISGYLSEGTNYANNGVFSMPFSKSTEVMFYNKTKFDAEGWDVPTTWSELWALCDTIHAAYPGTATTPVYPFGYDSDDNLFITKSAQQGFPYTSATGDHYLFNNADSKAMVTDLKSQYDKGYFITKGSSANSTFTSTQFAAQTLFMTVGSTGGTTYNYSENFTTGVTSLPQIDVNNKKAISQGPSICFFKRATTAEKQAAWLFYKFITNSDNSANWSTLTGYNPVRVSSYSTNVFTEWEKGATAGKDLLLKNVQNYTSANYAEAYFTSPAFKGSATARTEVSGLLSSVLLGTKTIDKAFDDAITDCLFAS